jgi:hypothetical protein
MDHEIMPNKEASVYVLGCHDTRMVKIGISSNPKKRIEGLILNGEIRKTVEVWI